MNNVPLNATNEDCRVNVIRCQEKNPKKKKSTKWMWITDIPISETNIKKIARGGRSRWKVENEAFNTLKKSRL